MQLTPTASGVEMSMLAGYGYDHRSSNRLPGMLPVHEQESHVHWRFHPLRSHIGG